MHHAIHLVGWSAATLSLLAIASAVAAEPSGTATQLAEDCSTAPAACPSELLNVTKTTTLIDAFRPTPAFDRHDPSNIIRYDGRYWGFYTRNSGDHEDVSVQAASSGGGYSWTDVGEAIGRGPRGDWDESGVMAPYVVHHKGKFYLFYTGFRGGDLATRDLGCAIADRPNGPWTRWPGNPILRRDPDPAAWDSGMLGDSNVIFYHGQWWLYYKSRRDKETNTETRIGVAVADEITGPYRKHPANPLFAGHAFSAWRHRDGVAAVCGEVSSKIKWSPDGLHFRDAGEFPNQSTGLFSPEADADPSNLHGFDWGLEVYAEGNARGLRRFDCTPRKVLVESPPLKVAGLTTDTQPMVWAGIEQIGPPTRYSPDVERYRFGACDVANPAFYPIPQDRVTRASYMRAVDASDPAGIAARPEQGMSGPSAFLPVLAKYAQTGQAAWGNAIVAMLKHFHAAMQQEVAAKKWVEEFEFAAAYIPLYRGCLLEKGGMKPDDAWFREMWLYYCRNLHVWGSEPIEWRGGCHRAMPEAISKGLAARWYPDIPEAAHWTRYSGLVLGDFRRHKDKDASQNDTGYMFTSLTAIVCNGDLWTGDDTLYTDPGIRRVWERLMVEVSPDGAVNPYGPSSGWNAAATTRMYMLERLAAKTRDGRYRFAAHKLFNYLRYQLPGSATDSHHVAAGPAALAWLYADDSIAPVQPFAGSLWNERMEIARLPHKDKQLTERLLGNADPDPNKGCICCAWVPTGKLWPDKLVLRSGWSPGDFFALVELHPTSFPANPGGIMAMDRWGVPFTQIVTSKGASVENRALIEDLGHTATRRLHPDPLRINETWDGRPPDIRSEVTCFKDTPEAAYARVRVQNMDGLPVVYEREFVFVKNRFLATREIITFEESFKARVAPLWNTHNVGPQLGSHWANTFIHQPVGENHARSMKAPPADLLVWFAPRVDCRLQVVDRLIDDPRALACPNQVRYLWQGTPAAGQQLVFTQLYYPHPPYRPRATTNNPIPGVKAAYADELQATAHASGIKVIRDDPEATVLRLELEPGNVEWVAFNPQSKLLKLDAVETNEPMAYLRGVKN